MMPDLFGLVVGAYLAYRLTCFFVGWLIKRWQG